MKIEPNRKSLRVIAAVGCSLLLGATTRAQTAATPAERKASSVDVTVTAERLNEITPVEQPGSKTVINAGVLEQRGVADMGQIVRYEPLVNAPKAAVGSGNVWDGNGYTGYNIRGIEGNRVSLDIDGIPLPDAAPKPDSSTANSFGVGRDYVEIENFSAVEINSGTSAAGRGVPGLGGSVGYVTKTPGMYLNRSDRPYYVGYKFTYDSVNEGFAHTFTGAAQAGSLQALVVYTHRDGEQPDSKGTAIQNEMDWKSDSILSKVVWNLSQEQNLEFAVDYFKRDVDTIQSSRVSASYPGGITQASVAERFTVSATHKFQPTALAVFDSLQTKVYLQDSVSRDDTVAPNYVTGGIGYRRDLKTAFHNDAIGLNSDAIKRIGDSHQLSYGISANRVESSRPWTEVRTRLSDNVITQVGAKDRMPAMKTTKLAAYLSDKIALGSRFTLTPGVRFEYQNQEPEDLSRYVTGVPSAASEIKKQTDTKVVPSLIASYQFTDSVETYVSYKRGVRFPTAVEKTGTYDSFSYTYSTTGSGYAVLANANLKEETSDAFELGVNAKPIQGLTLHVAGFYTKYKNYIDYASQPLDPVNYPTIFLLYRPENVGEAEIYGVEGSAKLDLGAFNSSLAGFSTQLAAGRSNSSATNTTTGVKRALSSVGPFKGSLTFAYDAPSKRYGVALIGTYIDGKQSDPDVMTGGTTALFYVPTARLVDLTAYLRLTKNITLNAGLYNVTDEKWWDYYSARTLSAPTTAANQLLVERYVQPGVNGFVSISFGF